MAQKNAARLLYERLRDWRQTPPSSSVLSHRGGEGWWGLHAEAIHWLEEIADQLEEMSKRDPEGIVPFADESLDRLRRAVFAVDVSMIEAPNFERTHLSIDDLNALHLVSMGWQVNPPANPGVGVDLLDVAREIEDLVIAADDLAEESRAYLLTIVQHLQVAVVDVAVYGAADVLERADQLSGALLRYLNDDDTKEREKTQGLIIRLVNHVKVFMGLVPPTAKAIESTNNLFGNPLGLPPGT